MIPTTGVCRQAMRLYIVALIMELSALALLRHDHRMCFASASVA